MAEDVLFSNDDMSALADKLDQLADRFDERERLLLLSLLKVAADRIEETTRLDEDAEVSGFSFGRLPASGLAGIQARPIANLPLGDGFRGAFKAGAPGTMADAGPDMTVQVMTRTGGSQAF